MTLAGQAAQAAKSRVDKALRYRMREAAQDVTRAAGVRGCGKKLLFGPYPSACLCVDGGGSGRTFFGGVLRCGSVWECPVCAPAIQARRAEELRAVNRAHTAAGGALYLLTLTLPHDEGDALKPLRVHVATAWRKVCSGAPWARWKARAGVVGMVRALECTHGAAGWHPHLHIAVYTEAPLSDATLGEWREWFIQRWRDYVTRPTAEGRVYRAPLGNIGATLQPLSGTDYLAKMGLLREVVSSTTKRGRGTNATPFELLRDVVQLGDTASGRRARALWQEWAEGIKGARQLTTTRGLFARYRLAEPVTDEAASDEGALLASVEVVHRFTREEWEVILTGGLHVRLQLLRLPQVVPRESWPEAIQDVLDAARGLAPVPFTIHPMAA